MNTASNRTHADDSKKPALSVRNLSVSFKAKDGLTAPALENVSFDIKRGETLALVGESGSGKSVTGLTIMNLIGDAGGVVTSGEIFFNGSNITSMSRPLRANLCGRDIGMIFQEPMTSLNPVFTVGEQIAEVFRIHRKESRAQAKASAIAMLDRVKISAPARRFNEYPHQLSGGMRQRVMIAMALACEPQLLIADEPTTALDVTVQAQIMHLMLSLQAEMGMSILLITHDFGVVAQSSDRVAVLYGGRIAEMGSVSSVLSQPRHPYTKGLLNSMPKFGHSGEKLDTIRGTVPSLGKFPPGCRFANRCPDVLAKCGSAPPVTQWNDQNTGDERAVACWLEQAKGDFK